MNASMEERRGMCRRKMKMEEIINNSGSLCLFVCLCSDEFRWFPASSLAAKTEIMFRITTPCWSGRSSSRSEPGQNRVRLVLTVHHKY